MKFKWVLGSAGLLILTACGGGGGGSSNDGPQIKEGRFIDSAVSGLSFSSGEQSGKTDVNGTFFYEEGKAITFSIGQTTLGTTTGKPIITPVDLVDGANDESNPTVINITRVLLTLDDNANPDDGILITDVVSNLSSPSLIPVDLDPVDFSNDGDVETWISSLTSATNAGARTLVGAAAAEAHLRASLLGLMAGTYSGNFRGDDSGRWEFTVDDNGQIEGCALSNDGTIISVTGAVDSDGESAAGGAISFDGETITTDWEGEFDHIGGVDGDWESSDGSVGLFDGARRSGGSTLCND